MATIPNKKYKEMSREEKFQVYEYLTQELWRQNKSSVTCPVCGGTITSKDIGSGSITECNMPGCVKIEIRGI